MADAVESGVRERLVARRKRLEAAVASSPADARLAELVEQVDEALESLDSGSYGLCKTCNDPIETDRLIANPLERYCLDHLTPSQQRALEDDLELASKLQATFLPKRDLRILDWELSYHYEGAGPTSGDYCDVLGTGRNELFFTVGDVKGKGLAASLVMAHLHATLRTLVSLDIPLVETVQRASRMLCEATLPDFFVTLVFGRAGSDGEVEVCNAGHVPPLLSGKEGVRWIESTGFPLGMFCEALFTSSSLRLSPGDALVLCTDGLTEAENASGDDYGKDRLAGLVDRSGSLAAPELVRACVGDLREFLGGKKGRDDLTVMVVRRSVRQES